ncbi:MAG: GTP-binding protein [Sedimentisphaerales bacterium]|nr:GTP-binding protein [Sedimentisphaerales bacterium]
MRENLHFVVVGHVDHGKSTLIGRLLYDTNSLPPDKMEEVRKMSKEYQGQPEFAFVMDHLEEERNQRITIDTAQIFFSTDSRDYVIIDAPGHKQFLKNMITGASQAEAALLLIDAQEGLREQTHRHAYMLSLLGLRQIVVIVNKMDLVGYDQQRYNEIREQITKRLAEFSLEPMMVIPISARMGDNVAQLGENLSWYKGDTLLGSLDKLRCIRQGNEGPVRFPVQDVYEMDGQDILVGRVASGVLHKGDQVLFRPSDTAAVIEQIKVLDGELDSADAGKSIGLVVKSDKNGKTIKRGQVACPSTDNQPRVLSDFSASVFWMSEQPLKLGDKLDLKCATQQVPCKISKITNRLDSSSLDLLAEDAQELCDTEVAQLTIETEQPICLDAHESIAELGQFVLMRNNDTIGGGVVH